MFMMPYQIMDKKISYIHVNIEYSGHNLKDDRDKLTAEVMLEPSIGGAIKIDNNQNLLMVGIDENL